MSYLWPFLLSFFSVVIFTPLVIFYSRKYKLLDDPKRHKHPALLHKKVIPRAGGLAVFLGFLVAILATIPHSQKISGIIFGGGLLVVVGIVDDKFDIKKSSVKMLAQILAAVIVVGSGVGISFITNPFHFLSDNSVSSVVQLDNIKIFFNFLGTHSVVVWADLFAVFWIVWVINMVNFSSGVDGQMPGIVFVTLIVIFATSLRFSNLDPSQVIVAKLAIVGAGATLGFLVYNLHPAKIFPGDSGSYFLGYLIAVISIFSQAKVGTAILVMAIPLVDGVFTVIRRVAEGNSPFSGDRKHLHHRLLEMGWSQRQVALFYWLLCAILGAAALVLPASQKIFAGVVVATVVVGGLLWLNMNLPNLDRR